MEDPLIDPSAFLEANLVPIVGSLIAFAAVAIVTLAVELRRVSRLQTRLARLTRGADGGTLESVLTTNLDRVDRLDRDVDLLSARTARLEADERRAFQRIGIVRFNPFEDTGGNQSFALALLDADDDGLVVSSLHSRNGTRIYAKGVSRGRPEAALSDEEREAIELARSASLGRAALAERVGAPPRQGVVERPRARVVERSALGGSMVPSAAIGDGVASAIRATSTAGATGPTLIDRPATDRSASEPPAR